MDQRGFPMGGPGGNGAPGGNSVNPNDLDMSESYGSPFQNNYADHANPSNAFSSGSAVFGDDELLDGLSSATDFSPSVQSHGHDFGGMNGVSMAYSQPIYSLQHHGLPMEQPHQAGLSSTPDGNPIASPFARAHGFGDFRHMQHAPPFGTMQSPLPYSSSMSNTEMNDPVDPGFLGAKAMPRVSQVAQRPKPAPARGPLTPKTAAAMAGHPMSSEPHFGAQPIRPGGAHHEKSQSWVQAQTPNSLGSFPTSGFASPLQPGAQNPALHGFLKGGMSMPAKLGTPSNPVSSQEAKKKRRRESHNLVERRRRDNINERIQDLSKLVPPHRLEDEKIRKAIHNGTPLSPTLSAVENPTQATSALAGPGSRRAAAGSVGNITTGLPIEDKDKGPNKGDILNGAVSWTRDLMWAVKLKMDHIEELMNLLADHNIDVPFQITEDEQRMHSEIESILHGKDLTYSRFDGSGLRVPHHTNYKGERLNANGHSNSISPNANGNSATGDDMMDEGEFLVSYDEDDADVLKEESADYGRMDYS